MAGREKIKITRFGPSGTRAGQPFNVQENGLSALWFEIDRQDNAPLVVEFQGVYLKSVMLGNILTALVPENLLSNAAQIRICVFPVGDESAGDVVDFSIQGFMPKIFGRSGKVENKIENKANFFMVGAPRSGTTSLYWHLSSHPDIFMSPVKEPFYFDERARGVVEGCVSRSEDYSELFRYAHVNASVIGEASTTYLSSRDALERINKYNRNAKILAILRNPIDASLSLFLRMKEGGKYEHAESFDSAWRGQVERSFLNDYRNLFALGDQVEFALQLFGEQRLKIVLFDEFKQDSALVYRDILNFLGLPGDEKGLVRKGNSANWAGWGEAVSRDVYMEMIDFFAPQVSKLEYILGKNIDGWLRPYEDN